MSSFTHGWIIVSVIVVIGIVSFLARLFPRLSVFFLGPTVLISTAAFFIKYKKYFFFFETAGSPAGMIIPAIMWVILLAGFSLGLMFISTGLHRLTSKE